MEDLKCLHKKIIIVNFLWYCYLFGLIFYWFLWTKMTAWPAVASWWVMKYSYNKRTRQCCCTNEFIDRLACQKNWLACSDLKGTSQQFSNKVPRDNSCVITCIFSFFSLIFLWGWDWITTSVFFLKQLTITLTFKQLQAVRSVASSGKFYQLPPDKENTV